MKAMNMGRKKRIPTGIFLVDYLARWYGHHKKPPKMCGARGQDLRSAPVAMIFTSTSGRF
jgi:hypothetical protein